MFSDFTQIIKVMKIHKPYLASTKPIMRHLLISPNPTLLPYCAPSPLTSQQPERFFSTLIYRRRLSLLSISLPGDILAQSLCREIPPPESMSQPRLLCVCNGWRVYGRCDPIQLPQ